LKSATASWATLKALWVYAWDIEEKSPTNPTLMGKVSPWLAGQIQMIANTPAAIIRQILVSFIKSFPLRAKPFKGYLYEILVQQITI
jgi:hypothetical protein